MDVVGRIYLADGTELSAITGVDDHSRFCVCARLVARATARPVCDALALAMRAHGVPDQILTDNGKVFTARFGRGPGPVLFDRICADNGIRHLLTAPYSPTTTGKVERFHKTLRKEWVRPNDRTFASIVEAQASLDAWVTEYNTERPHQSLGMEPPVERFGLAHARNDIVDTVELPVPVGLAAVRPAGVSRWVDQRGQITLARFSYRVGATYAGECVEVVCHGGLVEILHAGVLVATHAQRHQTNAARTAGRGQARQGRDRGPDRDPHRRPQRCGQLRRHRLSGRAVMARASIEVSIVGGSVQLAKDGKVIRVHPIRHDRSRELGAFANPKGRPRRAAQA